jgi:hypothetical protein
MHHTWLTRIRILSGSLLLAALAALATAASVLADGTGGSFPK